MREQVFLCGSAASHTSLTPPPRRQCFFEHVESQYIVARHVEDFRGAAVPPQYTQLHSSFMRSMASACPCLAARLMYWRAKGTWTSQKRPRRNHSPSSHCASARR